MEEKKYETKSLEHSAFLMTVGNRLSSSRIEGRTTIFIFDNFEKVQNDLKEYFNGKQVEALKHWEVIKSLKALVLSNK